MILQLDSEITEKQKEAILNLLRNGGCIVREFTDSGRSLIGAIGGTDQDPDTYLKLPGVANVIPISTSFKLVSRQVHPKDTIVTVGDVAIGGDRIVVVAGPCAVENMEQTMATAREVKKYGAVLFRGGAYKPRTSPYAFQGLKEEGLKILATVRAELGLGVVTEITSPDQADLMMKYIDVVQIGARSMQNFELLKCVGRMKKPVILKRGLAATIEEWLMAAEYILSEGNDQVVLCERGIRTFEPYTRNTLDLSAIPVLKKQTHLPIIVDPSHATGIREKVSPMARAAIAAGADGLMIEVHNNPDVALSDGPQSLYPKQFGRLMRDIYVIAPVVGKQLDFDLLHKAKAVEQISKQEGKGPQKAAFLGEVGTFSHRACVQYFGSQVVAVPALSFKEIFDAVKTGKTDFGIVPLENALTGSIHENYDRLIEYDLNIIGEITLRIEHCLVGFPGTKIESIRRVYSHPQVFQQCRLFLEQCNHWELISVEATATGARQVKESGDHANAAISSKEAAAAYDLEVLEEGIETNPRNFTRFVVIGTRPMEKGFRRKSSLIYSIGNVPGALYATIKIFADADINLVKLESRPIHGKPWEYMFYIDIEADAESETFKPVLEELKIYTDFLKVLGSY